MALCHCSINFSDFCFTREKIYRFSNYDTVYIYRVIFFCGWIIFFSYARFYKKFMEQWHKAMPHKAFSDLKYGTEHGTMAQDFKIYGTEPYFH
ncbi:hypothetical protein NEIFLAOT_01759 [Neisseria flavescens NRL30031/H210]|uniref:Uncharacterized protein n=1 Tax=Neisseria flavescens NRL30031/H210 TaxID=546264 RepID=C0EP68_NEIFL|nr:hypothetical protein NEIFLAOT_01759 [Neisseria flavescens NRL30031/H210]